MAAGRTWAQHIRCVTKPVFATTTVMAVNLDSSRAEASQPRPCYPDICFAVDNFDNAFEDLVRQTAAAEQAAAAAQTRQCCTFLLLLLE